MCYKVLIMPYNVSCVWHKNFKLISITQSECVSYLGYLHATHMRHICHRWPCLLYNVFPYFLIKRHDFRGKKEVEHKMCVLISVRRLSEIFLILTRTEWDIIINVHRSACKVTVIFVRFWWNLNFLHRYSTITQLNFLKPVEWETSCSMKTDGRTDGQRYRHGEGNGRFSPFCERA